MANWNRRSPQADICVINPADPVCQAPQSTTQSVVQITSVAESGVGELPTSNPAYSSPTTTDTGLASTIPATAVTGFPQTTISAATHVSTGPAVVTDPSEAGGAQATSKSRSSDGVNKGAVAGIAIGTCFIGAAIAFGIAFLLFKRRDRKFVQKTCPSGYPIYADSSPELVMMQKSAMSGSPYVQVAQTQMRTPVPVPSRVPVPKQQNAQTDTLAGILPPAVGEHDVRSRVSALFGQIHRHVDTYYRDVHASITPSMNSDLESFGKDVDLLELLQNCSKPTVALKHALVVFILGLTGPSREADRQTLWPDELAHIIKSHTSGRSHRNNSSRANTDRHTDSAQITAAETLHRRLSVYLYIHANALPPATRSQSRLSNLSTLSLTRKTSTAIREAAEHFSLTFFPWANPIFGDQERESGLAGIIGEILECRLWLFGLVGQWSFEWEVPGRGAVVVAPSLVVREHGGGPRKVILDQNNAGI